MRDARIVGKCKKEISEILPMFTDRDDFKKEFKIKVGDIEHIQGTDPLWDDKEEYYVRLHTKTITMSREELEEHFEVVWERNCFNTCIRDGLPCKKLAGIYQHGDTSLTRRRSASCRISFEIGRGGCYMFEHAENEKK